MQTLVITFQIPDGVQFQVNATPAVDAAPSAPTATKPTGPTAEDLRRAFMEAVLREKAADPTGKSPNAIAALGKPTLKEVEPAEFAAVIARLNGVGK